MKTKHVLTAFLFFVSISIACNPFETSGMKHVKDRMRSIDAYLSQHKDDMIILAKLPGKDTLIDIKRIHFPLEMGTIYSFVKDSSGQLIVFGETQIRKNDDWETVSSHHFDKDGSTIAFSNQNIFKNTVCGEKVINEIVVEYYDRKFARISKEYTLIDSKGDPFNKKKCQLPYNTPYKAYRNSDSLMKKISLPVKSS